MKFESPGSPGLETVGIVRTYSDRGAHLHYIAVREGGAILKYGDGSEGHMEWTQVIWDPLRGGNVEHVEKHDLTTDEVDHVLEHYESKGDSRTSGRPCLFGYAPDGRYIMVVYEQARQVLEHAAHSLETTP